MPKITVHNIATDEIIEREMTRDEIMQIKETFPDAFEETSPE